MDLLDNVWMLEVLQQTNLSDCCTWDTIIFLLQSNLLDGNDLTSLSVFGFVDDTVGTLSQFVQLLVLFNTIHHRLAC